MVTPDNKLGDEAIAVKGWWKAWQWLVLRRVTQLGILAAFLAGPWLGIWIVKGNLASSLTLGVLPLSDPYLIVQSMFAGHLPELTAISGAIIVLVFYTLIGGRSYCAWVCPVNIITDTAECLRRKLGIKSAASISRNARYWLLAASLLLASITGTMAWELVNPATLIARSLVFGVGFSLFMIAFIFVLDTLVSRRAWCGHLCPMGAFYSLLGYYSIVRVSAYNRSQCDDCMECFAVCPEPQVIKPALKGEAKGNGPVIVSANCTNCGRCIDICSKDVFKFDSRFNNKVSATETHQREVLP